VRFHSIHSIDDEWEIKVSFLEREIEKRSVKKRRRVPQAK